MLIVCCGMPRAGSTLQYQIACELVERAGLGVRPGAWPTPLEPGMWADARPLHVAKVHDPDPRLASGGGFDPRFTRFIYAFRDVRDAIASHLQKITGAGEPDIPADRIGEVVRSRMLEPWAHFTLLPGVLVSRYETMIGDIAGEARRIAMHCEIEADEAMIESIGAKLDLGAQRRYIESRTWEADEAWDDRTLLHRNHVRDGRVGKFRDVLSPAQLGAVERVAGVWLRERGYDAPAGAAPNVGGAQSAWVNSAR